MAGWSRFANLFRQRPLDAEFDEELRFHFEMRIDRNLARGMSRALGIGANTVIYSLLHAALLSPLPFPDAGRLVSVVNHFRTDGTRNMQPRLELSTPMTIPKRV